MKTKFTQIVKIKKQKVDKVELELTKINNKISDTDKNILNTNKAIKSHSTPTSGNFSQIKLYQDNLNSYLYELKMLKEKLNLYKSEKNKIDVQLKEANLDYEKMKYIENVEVQKILKEAKIKEENELNEISIMLHNNKG